MSGAAQKFTHEQVETMELAPGAERQQLEGWVPEFAREEDVRGALERAFDYRGDVTLTLRGGERVEAYIFDRQTGSSLADSYVRCFVAGSADKRRVSYADVARLEFTGRDCAAGKQWADWVRKYEERKAAGEKGIALKPEPLD